MVGQSVGNYRITKLLGEGGMGAVYLAEHPGIGRRVAVKVLLEDLARDQEMVSRFFNEARAANAVHHPGIVEVLDFGTLPSGASYIVMEFLEGESLGARMHRLGQLPVADGVDIAVQAALALGAAHAQGIIHRDLKPDNLYLIPDTRAPGHERVKVLDFGIAKLSERGVGVSGGVKTRTGVLMGTPLYMSPEQCRGTKEVDHRSDVYALGIILYEMLCGTPPFVSEGHGEMIHMHIAQQPPPPRTLNGAIPLELEAVILQSLAKDPDQRVQSMGELADALRVASAAAARAATAGDTGATTGAHGPIAPTPPRTLLAPVTTPARTLLVPDGPAPVPTPARRPPSNKRDPTTLSDSASIIEPRTSLTLVTRRRWVLPLAIAGGALAAVGAYGLVTGGGLPFRAAPPAPTAPTETAAPPAPAETERATAARPTPAKTISVSLSSDPPGARVMRDSDGTTIGVTPFKESWPARAGVERLRIERAGYGDETVVLPLDRDVGLTLALKQLPAAAAAAPALNKKNPRERPVAPRVRSPSPGVTKRAPAPATAPPRPEGNSEPVPL